MTIDTDHENGMTAQFDAVLSQAERIKDDTAALASSVNRLLEAQIRAKPVQSLLIGIAAGWLAGKLL